MISFLWPAILFSSFGSICRRNACIYWHTRIIKIRHHLLETDVDMLSKTTTSTAPSTSVSS